MDNTPKDKPSIPIVEDKARCVHIDYTNWRGERRVRLIKPIEIEYTWTQYHPVKQWLLRAKDMEDGKVKEFAFADIHSWRAATKESKKK